MIIPVIPSGLAQKFTPGEHIRLGNLIEMSRSANISMSEKAVAMRKYREACKKRGSRS
jgi:hypothetical protein